MSLTRKYGVLSDLVSVVVARVASILFCCMYTTISFSYTFYAVGIKVGGQWLQTCYVLVYLPFLPEYCTVCTRYSTCIRILQGWTDVSLFPVAFNIQALLSLLYKTGGIRPNNTDVVQYLLLYQIIVYKA